MKRLVWLVAVGALAACGDESNGSGGTGGAGGNDEKRELAIEVVNDEGRTFTGKAMQVVVREPERENAIAFVQVTLQAFEEVPPDSYTYDLQARGTGSDLENGMVRTGGMVSHPPEQPGQGKVEVDPYDGVPIFARAADKLDLALSNGWVEGEVTSSHEAVKATISGDFTLRCEILEGDDYVEDRTFASEFCARFADLRAE